MSAMTPVERRAAMAASVEYRERVASLKSVAALVVPATREVGALLKALRGQMYVHRGVRNVMTLCPEAATAADVDASERVYQYAWRSQRWSVDSRTLPEGFPGASCGFQLKLLLLDPTVLPASVVSGTVDNAKGEVECLSQALRFFPVVSSASSGPGSSTGTREAAAEVSAEAPTGTVMAALPSALRTSIEAAARGKDAKANMATADRRLLVAFTTVTIPLSYQNYTMPELLRMVLPSQHQSTLSEGNAVSRTQPPSGVDRPGVKDCTGGLNNAQNAPHELVALSGFEQVGHIAHVNLSKAHVPYQFIVGRVILDCNPTVLVVVNKTDAISSEFREFPMEIIAVRSEQEQREVAAAAAAAGSAVNGSKAPSVTMPLLRTDGVSDNALLTATVRQHGCVFDVPYNRVYWNSRLSHEHTRLVEWMGTRDVLFDAMAGVGPFAIPAAKRGVLVFGNDLNPASAEYMAVNREKNRVDAAALTVFNWDARDFLNKVVYDYVMGLKALPEGRQRKHVVMNLPATAVEFLDVFAPADAVSQGAVVTLPQHAGWYRTHRWNVRPAHVSARDVDRLLLIHVYCFSPAENPLEEAVQQVERFLGYRLEEKNKECVHLVRDVAPQKRMVCVSFTLPDAFWEHQAAVEVTGGDGEAPRAADGVAPDAGPAAQKRRIEGSDTHTVV